MGRDPFNRRFQQKRQALKQRYGLTFEAYMDIVYAQEGRCAICKCTPFELKQDMCVDHCHSTGKVRGVLCVRCNFGIGYFKDSPTHLQEAIRYLEKSRE